VFETAIELIKSDILVDNLIVSLSRVAKDFLVGSTLGFFIGVLIGAFFPTLLNTANGIRGVSKEYMEVGKVYQFSKARFLFLIIIPSALPSIVTWVRLSMSLSWMMVVGAEMISANSGIGQMMTAARDMFRTDIVMVGTIVIGIVGFLIDVIIKKLETAIIRWQMTVK
jgi:sulfonate transport system permease protein